MNNTSDPAATGRNSVVSRYGLSGALGCILFLLSAQACADYVLNVVNGSGSGSYANGSTVNIFANAYEDATATTVESKQPGAPLRVFDRWTGDTGSVADIYSPNTTVVMPAAVATVVAQFKDSPFGATPGVASYFPPNHSGVIFMFHGSSGNAFGLLSSSLAAEFSRDANANGFAVVAMDSYNRTVTPLTNEPSSWSWDFNPSAASNIDMQRVAAVRNSLIASGQMSAADPVYFWGLSSGGMFSSLFTSQVQGDLGFAVKANALMASPGDNTAMASTMVPTIMVAQANDSIVPYLAVAENFNALVTRGIPGQLWTNQPIPVHNNLFWGIPGLASSDSKAIRDALYNGGYLDAKGYLLIDPAIDTRWTSAIPAAYAGYSAGISDRLNGAYAEHTVSVNFNKKILDFYRYPQTIIPQQPSISGISPSSGTAGTVVTITGNNFIGVSSVWFNGINANYTYVSTTTLAAVAPAKVTTGPIQVVGMAGTASSAPFTVAVSAPVIGGFFPSSAAVGRAVSILGSNFVGITKVTFNGVVANVSSYGANRINTTVPVGATTGYVTVVGSGGTATSKAPFIVK